MTLSDFFKNLESKSTPLFREFLWILEERFGCNSSDLISGQVELSEEQQKTLKDWIVKRQTYYPIQYFLGQVEFMGLRLSVEEGALIPRMETEEIVQWALKKVEEQNMNVQAVLDIGSGTGCMGLGFVSRLESHDLKELSLIEPFEEARRSLRKNVESFGSHKTQIYTTKFEELNLKKESYDVILSNPPYIDTEDPEVETSVYMYEPSQALYSETNPISLIHLWVKKSYELLKPGGFMVFEMGYKQKKNLEDVLVAFNPMFFKDSFGKDRFFYIQKM